MKYSISFLYPRIMPRCDRIESVFQRFLEETVEFHEIIAEDVGVGSESFSVSLVNIVHDTFFIFLAEIESMERESEIFRHFSRLIHIGQSRAVGGIGDIVDHKTALHLIPCFPQQISDGGGIHPA